MDMRKFKYLDMIAGQILDDILKLPLTELETRYVLNEIYKFNFQMTNSQIKKMKNTRINELEEIAKNMSKQEGDNYE